MIEKRHEFNLETHIAFVDYEMAFDRLDRPYCETFSIQEAFHDILQILQKTCATRTTPQKLWSEQGRSYHENSHKSRCSSEMYVVCRQIYLIFT